jgi:hypothetical protein
MKKIKLIITITILNFNFLFAQDIKGIYDDFKRDSILFRELQNKKELSNQLLVYEYYEDNTNKEYRLKTKKLNLYSEIKKNKSCVWVIKDSINKIKLIVSAVFWDYSQWGVQYNILHFDDDQVLNLYRQEKILNYERSLSAQNWIFQENTNPCDYLIEGNEIISKNSFCSKDENEIKTNYCGNQLWLNYNCTDNKIIDIVKAYGIDGLFPPPQTYYLMQDNKLNTFKKISVLSILPNKISIKVNFSSSARCICEEFEIYEIYKNDKNEFKYKIDEDPEHTIKLNLDKDKVTSIEVAGGIGSCCSIETGQYFLKPKNNNIQMPNKQPLKTNPHTTKLK